MDGSTPAFSALIDLSIILTYIMISIGALAILYFAIKNMIQLRSESKKTFYSIGGIAVTAIIAYLLAPADILPSYEKYNISSTVSKLISTGLNSYSLLGTIAVALIIFYLFRDNWKKTILLLISLVTLIYLVDKHINLAINITYLLIGSALIIITIYSLKSWFSYMNLKKLLSTIGGVILIFGISYLLASPEVLDVLGADDLWEKYKITENTSQLVGMGLITFYILLAGTFITMTYSELSNKTAK